MELPFYFENNGYKLFSILHKPDIAKALSSGLVLCAPYAEEKLWAHRVFVNFARMLCGKGYWVLRFDQMGHGDSDGSFEDATVETTISDIKAAVKILREKEGVEEIGLMGLRWGATMAACAAGQVHVDYLVLWEPVISGEAYIQKCLRSNLATQLVLHKKVLRNREQLIDDLRSGEQVNIDGYLLNPEFYLQASTIDMINDPIGSDIPVLIVKINKKQDDKLPPEYERLRQIYSKNKDLRAYKIVQAEPFWGELSTYFQHSEELFTETLSWMDHIHNHAITMDPHIKR